MHVNWFRLYASYLHDLRAIHTKVFASLLLQFNRCQWKRFPLAGWSPLHLRNFCCFCYQAPLIQYDNCHSIKEVITRPRKCSTEIVLFVNNSYAPKCFWLEVFDTKIPIYDESQRWELTRSYILCESTPE